jgi:hypothetical protein
MFFEDVPITSVIGISPAQIFAQYGIDQGRFAQIINLPQNQPLRQLSTTPIQLGTALQPGRGSIRLPIDFTATVARAAPHVDMTNGLRPLPIVNGVVDRSSVKSCTHGVDIILDRTGIACTRVRWLQTVRKRNNPDRTAPLEFVDVGANGLPWYNDVTAVDPLRFDDTPCGPAATAMGKGLDFLATVSLAVWTMDRITLILGFTYGFTLTPGTTVASIRWSPPLRPATAAEFANQIRILELGINQFRQPTGGKLLYNPLPASGTINEGILFGRY